MLDVDTAAVLLLDAQLRGPCRPSGVWHRGGGSPGGAGSDRRRFRGSCCQNEEPVRLDRVDSTTVANPILWEKGIKVMLGVPLLSEDAVVGVLHVGRIAHRPSTTTTRGFSRSSANGSRPRSICGRLRSNGQQPCCSNAACCLRRLPKCPGLAFAVRYVPAEDRTVGGDWYDLFVLPSGQLWLVVGDVAGHGLQAAVVMGRIRSALRAYALLDTSPAHVLDLVERKVEQFEFDTFVTIVCAVTSAAVRHAHDRHSRASRRRSSPRRAKPASLPEARSSAPPSGAPTNRRRGARRLFRSHPTAVVVASTPMASSSGAVSPSTSAWRASKKRCQQGHPDRVAANIMRKLVGRHRPD